MSASSSTGGGVTFSTDDPRMGDYIRSVSLDSLTEAIQSAATPAVATKARPWSVVLAGFPYDEGCRRNGGRVGAEDGPEVTRRFGQSTSKPILERFEIERSIDLNITLGHKHIRTLSFPHSQFCPFPRSFFFLPVSVQRLGTVINPELNIDLRRIGMFDIGDLPKGLQLEQALEQLRARVAKMLSTDSNVIPFIVGGSNDESYANAAGLMDFRKDGNVRRERERDRM